MKSLNINKLFLIVFFIFDIIYGYNVGNTIIEKLGLKPRPMWTVLQSPNGSEFWNTDKAETRKLV